MTVRKPVISIIVPVHNAAGFLHTSLASLRNASLHEYEVIVVDDASIDGSAEIASEFTPRVICVPRRAGPAKARNLGAVAARGEYLVFLDADVRVHAGTIDCLANLLIEDPEVGAVFGSYDNQPTCPGIVSQFRNLLHHDIHQSSHKDAVSFWAGCGAIRRDSFLSHGGFDESYHRPNIEDIELGYRLHASGERIVLLKDACVTHLKSWTLWSMVKCDFASRGIPWTRLLLQKRFVPNDLNLKYIHRASVLAVYLSLLAFVAATLSAYWAGARAWHSGGTALLGLSLLAAAIAVNMPFYARLSRRRGPAFALLAIPLHVIHYGVCGAAFVAGCVLHAWGAFPGATRGSRDELSIVLPIEVADCRTTRPSAARDLEEQLT